MLKLINNRSGHGRGAGLAVTVMAVCAVGYPVLSVGPVQAQSLLDILFNTPRYQEIKERKAREERMRTAPRVRVSAPKYYTYRADGQRPVSFRVLERLHVAAKTPGGEVEAELPAGADLPKLSPFDAARIHLKELNIRALPEVGAALIAHYKANPAFIWVSNGEVNERARRAIAALNDADRFGLYRQDYAVTVPPSAPKPPVAVKIPETADTPAEAQPAMDPAKAPEPAETPAKMDAAAPAPAEAPATMDAAKAPAPAEAPATMDAAKAPEPAETPATMDAAKAPQPAEAPPAMKDGELPDATEAEASPPAPVAAATPDITGSVDAAPVQISEERARELIKFEMELSAKVLAYVMDAVRGRVDPNRLSGYHDLPRKPVALENVLSQIAAAEDAGAFLTAKNPASPQFQALVKELARLKAEGEGVVIDIKPGTLVKPGRKNPELGNVLAAIRHRSSPELLEKHKLALDAYQGGDDYTPDLVALVRDYQRENGLGADGIVGRRTIRTLTTLSNADKIRKVRLAMERLRWLPTELGTRHVFVNQPAFTATYMKDGRSELSMRVVVGKKSNQTSFFYDEIEIVEYHPYWGVPRSIIVNEMLPKLYNDPSYFDRAGYEVTTVTGRRVSSSSVDWAGVANKVVPINVRQLPGRSNALGELKILFPNKHAIYMHDTPAKSLFKRDRRAFSHGCIRLNDPRAMAAAVLGKDEDYIASRLAGGRNDKDYLEQKVPVYVSYFTAWPSSDGSVAYYDDVYDRDRYLLKAMDITSGVRASRAG